MSGSCAIRPCPNDRVNPHPFSLCPDHHPGMSVPDRSGEQATLEG